MTGWPANQQTLLEKKMPEQFVVRDNYLSQEPARPAAPIPGQSTQILLQGVDCHERLFCSSAGQVQGGSTHVLRSNRLRRDLLIFGAVARKRFADGSAHK